MVSDYFKRVAQVLFSLIIQLLCLLVSAWTLRWKWAWILTAVSIAVIGINFHILPASLIAERGKKKKDSKRWDRILTSVSILPMAGIYIVSGFDYRFGWSGSHNYLINAAGLILYFASSMFVTWSMVSNNYFSTMVRIQSDRGHKVVSGGPYRYIRHPGYLGFIFMFVSIPVSLGTMSGLIMSAVSASLFVIRTYLEDRTLRAELEGYMEYAERVRYRLLPFVW